MQKKQLKILRDHGELWTDQDFNDYRSKKQKKDKSSSLISKEKTTLFSGNLFQPSVFLSILINEEYFSVDEKVFKVVEEIFENYLYENNSDVYQEWVKNKLTLYYPLKEDKIRFLCDEIIGINEELDFLLMEAFGIQIPMPTDVKQLKSTWHLFLSKEDVARLIELLKFDIFEGERIESFGYPNLASRKMVMRKNQWPLTCMDL